MRLFGEEQMYCTYYGANCAVMSLSQWWILDDPIAFIPSRASCGTYNPQASLHPCNAVPYERRGLRMPARFSIGNAVSLLNLLDPARPYQ